MLSKLPEPWKSFLKDLDGMISFALDPYDLVLAKLERNLQRDRDDFAYLAQTIPMDMSILRNRYAEEMRGYLGRPEREDLTPQLWIDIVEERRQS